MVLVKKLKYFLVFILVKTGQKNVFDDILERKKNLFTLWKQEVKKVEKFSFFQSG